MCVDVRIADHRDAFYDSQNKSANITSIRSREIFVEMCWGRPADVRWPCASCARQYDGNGAWPAYATDIFRTPWSSCRPSEPPPRTMVRFDNDALAFRCSWIFLRTCPRPQAVALIATDASSSTYDRTSHVTDHCPAVCSDAVEAARRNVSKHVHAASVLRGLSNSESMLFYCKWTRVRFNRAFYMPHHTCTIYAINYMSSTDIFGLFRPCPR